MKISRTIKSASMILGISLSVFLVTFIVFAFSGPSQNPPACPAGEPGCDAPLHIGTAGQVKDGPLGIEGVFRAYSNLIVDGNVGIGTANPTTRLEVDGNIIASAPTASNHLTTKAYVDAQAGGGGGMLCTTRWNVTTCPDGWTLGYSGYTTFIGINSSGSYAYTGMHAFCAMEYYQGSGSGALIFYSNAILIPRGNPDGGVYGVPLGMNCAVCCKEI